MQKLIEKMRADWGVVAEDRRRTGDWSEEDETDIGAAVKAAIDSGNRDLIASWARWLADLAATTVALKAIALGIEGRMRAKAAEHRAAGKAGA